MKRQRLFLINVGLRTFSNFWAIPPMGLLSLAAHVRSKLEVEVAVVNQRVDNRSSEEIARQAKEFGADIVGISAMTTTACLLPEMVAALRRNLPRVYVVLGGPYSTAAGADALRGIDADVSVSGEGEIAFEQVVRAIGNDGSLAEIAGLVWRDRDGTVRQNPGSVGFVEDLDSLPMPAYDLIDVSAYWGLRTSVPLLWRRYGTLITSRGCPFGCTWCHNIFGKQIRMHSPQRIVEEMIYLHTKYGVDNFDIQDDTFNFDGARIIALCDLILRKGLKIKLAIPNGVRGDILTHEVIDALVDAGLYMSQFALDSGSPEIQKVTGKHLNIPRFLENCRYAAGRRVFIHGCCMLGFPTETENTLQQTIDIACDSHFHTASFFNVTPYPGTQLYDIAMQKCPERMARINYDMKNSSTIQINMTDLPDEIFYAYQRKAVRQFYLNPRRLMRIVRDHPQRWALPAYLPLVGYRSFKGILTPKE